jgi:DNA-binding NarL/FixJ family response regulator
MNETITILLADDQALFREGLRLLLTTQPEFKVIGEASNGEEAVRLGIQYVPSVVLMDLRMPILDGVAATRRLLALVPGVHVIVLTTFDDDEFVFEGMRSGAIGYLLKDVAPDKLFEAIRAAARGEYFLLPSITAKIMAEFSRIPKASFNSPTQTASPLTNRETEILNQVSGGSSNKEIAQKLVITEGTVKNHLTNILGKLGVRDRLQAVLKARQLGFILESRNDKNERK